MCGTANISWTLAARRMELGYGKLSLISDPGRSLVMLLVALSLDRESGLEFGVCRSYTPAAGQQMPYFFYLSL